MKTVALTFAIFATLLTSFAFSTNRESSVAAIFDGNEEKSSMGNEGKLQIGKNKNQNDGITFYVNENKLTQSPLELSKNSKIKLNIDVINSTGDMAYLFGWFDFNNDGIFEESEQILHKVIETSEKGKVKTINANFKIPNEQLVSSDPFVASFSLTKEMPGLTTQSNAELVDNKKYSDNMVQNFDFGVPETIAENGDHELYDIQIIDEDPVAVTLSAFLAVESSDGVKLVWNVASEINHAGYNIYRSEHEDFGYEKVNESIIHGWDGFGNFDGTYEFIDNVSGANFYKLEAVENDGNTQLFGPFSVQSSTVVEDRLTMPKMFDLKQNYPNPFNPSTAISFSLAEPTRVNITVFDVSGRIVTTLVDRTMEAGSHNVQFTAIDGNGDSLPSGVYFYTMTTSEFSATKSMTILK